MTPSNLVYVDLYNERLCSSPSGTPLALPKWVAGGSKRFSLRFLDFVDGFFERDYAIAQLRVSLGRSDERPSSGTYRIQVGSGASTNANTTPPLDWNAPAYEVENALNGLSTKPEDFVCSDYLGGVRVRRVSGATVAFSVKANNLLPRSLARFVESVAPNGARNYDLQLAVTPLAFSDSSARRLPSAPYIEIVQDGGADVSGTYKWNEIQALVVPPDFRGTYQLRYGFGKTALLDITSTPAEMQAALNAVLANEVSYTAKGEVRGSCVVTNPANNTAHIEFTGALAGINVAPLEIAVFSAPPGDWSFDLPLDRAELLEALRRENSIALPFEAEADFYLDPQNPSAGAFTKKLWKTTVTVERPALWPDFAAVPNIDWLHPAPKDYTPFSPDQTLTGTQHYVAALAPGSETYTVTHGLGTDALASVLVRKNTAGGRILRPDEYTVTVPNEDSITVEFPAPLSASHAVIIAASGPTSVFAAHKHTIAEIGNTVSGVFQPVLQNLLDDIGVRLARLEGLIGRADAAVVVSGNKPTAFMLPVVGEILPDLTGLDSLTVASQIAANPNDSKQTTIAGTELERQLNAAKAEIARLKAEQDAREKAIAEANKKAAEDAAKTVPEPPASVITRINFAGFANYTWPSRQPNGKAGWLFRALYDASVENTAVLPTSPAQNTVWRATGPILLPGGGGRRSQLAPADSFFSYDGRGFWRATRRGNTFYAQEMDRELVRAVIVPTQFPSASTLSLALDLTAGLVAEPPADSAAAAIARKSERLVAGAQYILEVAASPIPASEGGPNLGDEGDPVILHSSPLILSPATETHALRVELSRNASGVGSGRITRYGVAEATPSLPSGPFVLRVRLACFDTDDDSGNPRGAIVASMPATQLTITLAR